MLAKLLAAGMLPGTWQCDEPTRVLRRRVSRRNQLVRGRTRAKNQIHAVLIRNLGGRGPRHDAFGKKGRAWLAGLELPTDERETLEGCLREADFLAGEIAGVDREIARYAVGCAFTDRHAIVRVRADRHEDHAKELLADTTAIVTSDRWWAYAHLPLKRRQLCWAHLRRDFKAHAEGLGAEQAFGAAGLKACEELFWSWEIFQHTRDRQELKRHIRALRRELKPILVTHAAKQARYRYTRGMARNLLKIWPALWTFAEHRGIEPTNNHAERQLRGSVIYRKLSLGTQSQQGEQRIERLLSVHTTCRLQRRPLHDYLIDALTAHARGDPAPLLA